MIKSNLSMFQPSTQNDPFANTGGKIKISKMIQGYSTAGNSPSASKAGFRRNYINQPEDLP